MKFICFTIACCFLLPSAFSQVLPVAATMDELRPDGEYENVTNKKIYSDSSVTTFVIWVKKNVALHKHAYHTEQVMVLEGTANMRVGEIIYTIKPGDFIAVPENTPHSVEVTSDIPLKVISIQTPEFHGDDRIWLEE